MLLNEQTNNMKSIKFHYLQPICFNLKISPRNYLRRFFKFENCPNYKLQFEAQTSINSLLPFCHLMNDSKTLHFNNHEHKIKYVVITFSTKI